MNKLSNNILTLMHSDAYLNSNNPNHATVAKQVHDYFENKYGNSRTDATGHNITIRTAWRWHTVIDDKTCDICLSFANKIYEHIEEIPKNPHHKNCRCWIEEIELDDSDELVKNQIKEYSLEKTLDEEAGYVDNPDLIDQPTNFGITQPTLDKYNADHPNFNFPKKVADIERGHAKQIYKEDYYDERKIGEIKIPRISNSIFDMGVMSNFRNVIKMVQKTLNDSMGKILVVDGKMGKNTINALNDIPVYKVNDFMNTLKENRIEYLRTLSDWDKYGRGWTNRTNRY